MAELSQPVFARYPSSPTGRDRWIAERRAGILSAAGLPIAEHRAMLSPYRPYGFFLEEEPVADGRLVPCVTVLLTNRECPWRCAMCDLWQNTLTTTVPHGAIPAQIDYALNALAALAPSALRGAAKLYNAGSFFDPRAIPPEDDEAIAARLQPFERVVVECHPALLGERARRFRNLIPARLEVAMGLETAHPAALEKLNKRMTLDQFRTAADWLCEYGIDLRVFILVQPPFVPAPEALDWACRSIDFAFDCGATAISLLATRGGNGAMETLAATGDFAQPDLKMVEAAFDYGMQQQRGRVFTDTWDIPASAMCAACSEARIVRLKTMNLRQQIQPRVACEHCA